MTAKNNTFVDIARQFISLVSGELQPYVSEKITVLVDSKNQVSFFTPKHMQFAKYGRGPGKNPPLDPILEWVKKKRVQFRASSGKFISYASTAFIIQRSIAKNGTKNWVPNAPDALEEALNKGLKKYSKELAEFQRQKTLEELQLIYKDLFPEKIKL